MFINIFLGLFSIFYDFTIAPILDIPKDRQRKKTLQAKKDAMWDKLYCHEERHHFYCPKCDNSFYRITNES